MLGEELCDVVQRVGILQECLDLRGYFAEFFDGELDGVTVVGAEFMAEVQSQQIQAQELGGIGLRTGDGDFWTRVAVDDLVAFAVHARAHHIGDGEDFGAPEFCLAEHRQGVAGFAGLAYDDQETLFVQERHVVAEFRGDLCRDFLL